MSHRKEKLASFLLSQGLDDLTVLEVLGSLSPLCRAADNRQVDLVPAREFKSAAFLSAAQDVLQEQYLGPISPTFAVEKLQVLSLSAAQHLRSASAGTIRPTDWPPPGVSSFGVSALLFLHCAADLPVETFSTVHQAMHGLLLRDLRFAQLPDGGLLGSEWIVPWTTISDSVLFYVSYKLARLNTAADNFGRFVSFMPQALAFGFVLDDLAAGPRRELITIVGD